MKQLFVICILIVTLLGFQSVSAQKGDACYPRKNNNKIDVYSKEELKAIFAKDGVYFDTLRKEFIKNVNEALEVSGEELRVDLSNIDWVIENTDYVPKIEFGEKVWNGYRIGDKIRYVLTKKDTGYYAVFNYGQCSARVVDPNCVNLQKEPRKPPVAFVPPPPIAQIAKKDTVYLQGQTIVYVTANGGNVTNSGNSSSISSASVETPASTPTEWVVNDEPSYQPRPRRIAQPICYDCPVMPRRGAQGFIRLDIRGGGRQQQQYHPQQPTPQRGYMGGGRSGSNQGYMGGNGNQGGGRGN